MTCYMRHLGWLFEALELPYGKDERQRVDTALREALGLEAGMPCNELWARIKELPADDQLGLVSELRERIA